MTDAFTHEIGATCGTSCRGCRCLVALLACGLLIPAGCAHVPPQQQRLVSKPNMRFQRAAMFSSVNRLLTQFESSSASSVGGQSSGGSCSACELH